MNCQVRINRQIGLTLLEVLIASTVFMIGFSIMVFLLNQMLGRYSSKEMVTAYQIAKDEMEMTIITEDYKTLSKTEEKGKINFIVERIISEREHLVSIRINVLRQKTNRLLVTLYDEKYIP